MPKALHEEPSYIDPDSSLAAVPLPKQTPLRDEDRTVALHLLTIVADDFSAPPPDGEGRFVGIDSRRMREELDITSKELTDSLRRLKKDHGVELLWGATALGDTGYNGLHDLCNGVEDPEVSEPISDVVTSVMEEEVVIQSAPALPVTVFSVDSKSPQPIEVETHGIDLPRVVGQQREILDYIRTKVQPGQRLDRHEIASAIGTNAETVSVCISRLKDKGYVTTRMGSVGSTVTHEQFEIIQRVFGIDQQVQEESPVTPVSPAVEQVPPTPEPVSKSAEPVKEPALELDVMPVSLRVLARELVVHVGAQRDPTAPIDTELLARQVGTSRAACESLLSQLGLFGFVMRVEREGGRGFIYTPDIYKHYLQSQPRQEARASSSSVQSDTRRRVEESPKTLTSEHTPPSRIHHPLQPKPEKRLTAPRTQRIPTLSSGPPIAEREGYVRVEPGSQVDSTISPRPAAGQPPRTSEQGEYEGMSVQLRQVCAALVAANRTGPVGNALIFRLAETLNIERFEVREFLASLGQRGLIKNDNGSMTITAAHIDRLRFLETGESKPGGKKSARDEVSAKKPERQKDTTRTWKSIGLEPSIYPSWDAERTCLALINVLQRPLVVTGIGYGIGGPAHRERFPTVSSDKPKQRDTIAGLFERIGILPDELKLLTKDPATATVFDALVTANSEDSEEKPIVDSIVIKMRSLLEGRVAADASLDDCLRELLRQKEEFDEEWREIEAKNKQFKNTTRA